MGSAYRIQRQRKVTQTAARGTRFILQILNQDSIKVEVEPRVVYLGYQRVFRGRPALVYINKGPMPVTTQTLFRTRAFRQLPIRTLWRAALWVGHVLLRREGVYRDRARQVVMYLPPRLPGGGSGGVYIRRRYYEPAYEYLEKLVHRGDTVIDCGADLGLYTLAAAGLVGRRGQVLAVEPQTRAATGILRSAKASGFSQIRVAEVAVSDHDGLAMLDVSTGVAAASIVHRADRAEGAKGRLQVPARTLDSLVAEYELTQVDLINLDVAGAEEQALNGALLTLRRHRPDLLFPVHDPNDLAVYRCESLLRGYGYRFMRFSESGALIKLPGLTQVDPGILCRARPG